MQFLSFSFLALFTLCFFLYYAVKGRARNLILLVTSCIFIGWYYLPFLLTAVVVALFTFFWAQWMESRAKAGKWRIPEAQLIFLAVIGGSVGALAGMKVFHHKTRKPKFKTGVPAILIIQLIIYFLFLLNEGIIMRL